MLGLKERIKLITLLPQAFNSDDEQWHAARQHAHRQNAWFTENFIDLAINNIIAAFTNEEQLENWIAAYPNITANFDLHNTKVLGIVMAGNIPLVGFHDFLCGFLAGYQLKIKLSSKDTVLWEYIYNFFCKKNPQFKNVVSYAPMLKECDAYIATGSNNTARYFEQYFGKFPNIIRKNRTSVAVLTSEETDEELNLLAFSMQSYFGLGCRNISKIYVPHGYNFERLIAHTSAEKWQRDHNKLKNNYDYQLAMFILNKVPYMSNEINIFVENQQNYSPIAVVNYQFYTQLGDIAEALNQQEELQCIETSKANVSAVKELTTVNVTALGTSQCPTLTDYADNVDTMAFLGNLK